MNDATSAGAAEVRARNRAAAQMSVLTVVSRGTGFLRVVVVAAVLGTSYLGNVYQSSNMIPNILFELFAAGVLQSILVPIMVDAVDSGTREEAERTAGVVFGAILSLLAAIVAAAMVAAPLIIRAMFSGVEDPSVRAAQTELGLFLLWFFLPQVVFYAGNLVATAVLNARGSFGLPVIAPAVNNVVMIGVYLAFGALRGGQPPSLDLTLAEKLLLGIGTTAGVVLFCSVPVIGLIRSGFSLRPRFEFRHPVLRRLLGQGLWAAGFLALSQMLLVVVLLLSNAVEGGVVVYQLAFVLFMLPNSLFAVPVFTTAFPALTRAAAAARWREFADEVARAGRSIMFFTVLSAGALIALAGPVAHLVAFSNASAQIPEVTGATAAFALGLPGFSIVLLLTRAAYARGDTRSPTLVNLIVVLIGTAAMILLTRVVEDQHRIAAIGLGYAIGQTVGAAVLTWATGKRLRQDGQPLRAVTVPVLRILAAVGVAGLVVGRAVAIVGADNTVSALITVLMGASVLVVLSAAGIAVLGGPGPRALARTLGADPGRQGAT